MQRFILFLVAVSFLMDWYVFQGVKRLTAGVKHKRVRWLVQWSYWFLMVAIIIGFGWAIYSRFALERTTPLVQWFINAFFTLFVTKLVFVLVLLSEDIVRLMVAAFRFLSQGGRKNAEQEPVLPARRKFMSQLALLLAGIPFTAFLYGVTKGKYAYTVHRQVLFFEDLPEAFDGFTITQLSDIHAGSLDNAQAVQQGVELAKAQNSDLVVFTGDMVNNFATEIEPFINTFSQLKAPYGQFSVLGNHDYGMYHNWPGEAEMQANLEKLKNHHAAMGYKLLLDEHVAIEKEGEKLILLGVENWGKGFIVKGNIEKALTGVDNESFKILLSHDPSHWSEIVKKHPSNVHLTLSGHTHGMQFGVETPLIRWSPVQYRYENWAGLAQHNNRMLYVNRGFGFIGFSGRVGIWPEITVLELRKGKA